MRAAWLVVVLTQTPDVKLPPKQDIGPPRRPNTEVVMEGVRRAVKACTPPDAGPCLCAALKRTRFDVDLDGGTMTVAYPLNGVGGPSFTIGSDGRVTDCAF